MKNLALSLILGLSVPIAAQNPFGEKPKPVQAPPEEIHTKLEDMPRFPGGAEAMQKYLGEQISMPRVMRGVCNSRRLIAGFVVEKDGTLSQIAIIKSINGCPDFDFEVIRVIRNMPKWVPGKLNGQNVRCFYRMPVYIG